MWIRCNGTVVMWALMGLSGANAAAAESLPPANPPSAKDNTWVSAVEPKPLTDHVKNGLAWLVRNQLPDGGWGQGEESADMGGDQDNRTRVANVADTSIAALALIRSGNSPQKGPFAENVRRAVAFVCGQIEESDASSLSVTNIQGTRLQSKLGTYIDTFLAAMFLAEVDNRMTDAEGNERVAAAIARVMDKIEKNQQTDGSFNNQGWAPALAQSMASKAVNRAVQAGASVNEQVRERAEDFARSNFDEKSRSFAGGGSAGVELYAWAANLGAMQDADNTNTAQLEEMKKRAATAPTETERNEAMQQLERFAGAKDDLQKARNVVAARLDDPRFIAGFGSNGGEEFLSYMNIGESLVVDGGSAWQNWDKSITQNMNRIQNPDGSWTGHHCITGRTFCTAAALLVLTVDRAPVPLAAKIKKH